MPGFLYLASVVGVAATLGFLGWCLVSSAALQKFAGATLFAALTPHVLGIAAWFSLAAFPGSLLSLQMMPIFLCLGTLIISWVIFRSRIGAHRRGSVNFERAVVRRSGKAEVRTHDRALIHRLPGLISGLVVFVALFVIVLEFLRVLSVNTFPTIANDALTYLAEARYINDHPALASLKHGLGGAMDGLPPTHPHTQIFSLFLAQALAWCPRGASWDIPDDLPVRIAFQVTVFLLVAALAAASRLVSGEGRFAWLAPVCTILLFFLFPPFEYMSFSSSRDPFRLVPLVALFCALSVVLKTGQLGWILAIGIAILTGFSFAAHTINGYFLFVMAFGFGIMALGVRLKLRVLAGLAAAGVVGISLPLWHYVTAFGETGNPLGNGMNYFHYIGTPLQQTFLQMGNWGKGGIGVWAALVEVLAQHGLWATSISSLVAVVTITAAGLRRKFRNRALVFLSVLFLAFLIVPLLDMHRFLPIDMKEALISNFRYAHTIFIFAPILIGAVIVDGADWISQRSGVMVTNIFVASTALTAAILAHIGLVSWRTYENWDAPKEYLSTIDRQCALARNLPANARWLSDRPTVRYRCDVQPVFLYSPEGRKFFVPGTIKAARTILIENQVELVSFEDTSTDWWPQTTFYKALTEMQSEGTHVRTEFGPWVVFYAPRLADRQALPSTSAESR
jgi:hypothetical protein